MRYLFQYFMQFKRYVGNRVYYLLALTLIAGFMEGVGVTLFLPILNKGFGDDKLSGVMKTIFGFFHIGFSFKIILIFILAFFCLRSLFVLTYDRYFGKVSANLIITLRNLLLNKVFSADYLYLLSKETGHINNTLMREIGYVVDAFDKFALTVNPTIYGVIYMSLAMILNFKVSLIILIVSPLFILMMLRLNEITGQASRDFSFYHGRFNSDLIQALSKVKYLKATSSHPMVMKIIDKGNKKLGTLKFKNFFLQSISTNVFEPLVIFVIVALLFYYVIILKKDVNEVIFLALLFLQIMRQLLAAQGGYRKFLVSIGSIENYNRFIAELDEHKEDLHLSGIAPDFDAAITFKKVTVVFPNGKKVLENVNITIKPRSTVAFVGHSGSGKSTIANMITGIIKPTSGGMRFGDIPYEKINLEALRRHTGYVTQEDIIFNANIKNNISLWDENPDEARLKKAAEIAYMADFLKGLPNGYDAMLGDNGLDISGGQRQRVTIARELYKDTRLLILDEATSALDAKYEKALYDNLKEYKGQKTMVVIAHRLSTIKNADYIYVMDGGRIAEEGTFEGLSTNKDTKFYQICQLQSV